MFPLAVSPLLISSLVGEVGVFDPSSFDSLRPLNFDNFIESLDLDLGLTSPGDVVFEISEAPFVEVMEELIEEDDFLLA